MDGLEPESATLEGSGDRTVQVGRSPVPPDRHTPAADV